MLYNFCTKVNSDDAFFSQKVSSFPEYYPQNPISTSNTDNNVAEKESIFSSEYSSFEANFLGNNNDFGFKNVDNDNYNFNCSSSLNISSNPSSCNSNLSFITTSESNYLNPTTFQNTNTPTPLESDANSDYIPQMINCLIEDMEASSLKSKALVIDIDNQKTLIDHLRNEIKSFKHQISNLKDEIFSLKTLTKGILSSPGMPSTDFLSPANLLKFT